MADSSSGSNSKPANRRSFLKIGAGVVVGAVVAGAGVAAYDSSVISSNSSSSSSTVSSLSSELDATTSALNSANAQISSLSSQLTATQGSLSSANSQLAAASSTNSSLSTQLASTQGQLGSATAQISTLQSQISSLNTTVNTTTGFLALSAEEASVLEAALEIIIPTDSNGPGAQTAGSIFFIDRQLSGKYGWNGNMYMSGPFYQPNTSGSITVEGVNYSTGAATTFTYSEGTVPATSPDLGYYYQYPFSLREFWRAGLENLNSYAMSTYGNNTTPFYQLSTADQTSALTDLWNNKPTSFGEILPSDFAYELFFMAWAGFTMDPLHGGNKGMVGWTLTGFSGVNNGNAYGEGLTLQQLMVATTPTKLQPFSLAQFQAAAGFLPSNGSSSSSDASSGGQ